MKNHARLGPSNHRWPHCPGSVREEAAYPDVAGEAAIDGTGSHLLLEMCLDNNVSPSQYDGQVIGVNTEDNPNGWLIGPDRIDRVKECLSYITRRSDELAIQFPSAVIVIESESKSDPGGMFGRDDWWGTVDVTISAIDPANDSLLFIEVCDYKDGRMFVGVKGNTQLISYMAGKLRPYIGSGPDLVRPFNTHKVQGCRISIVQPKTNPSIRYEDMSIDDAIGQAEVLSLAAHQTDKQDAPLIAGKHCQWCKHNPKRGGGCKMETQKSVDVLKKAGVTDLSDILTDLTVLDDTQLADIYDVKSSITDAFTRIEAEIKQRIEDGKQVPGYKMATGRISSVWNTDEETIVKALKGRRLKNAQIYPAKLISVAQMRKLEGLTKEQCARLEKEFVTEKSGSLVLKKVDRNELSLFPFKDVDSFTKPISFR